MSTPVPRIPQSNALAELITGAPVSARHGQRWVSQIAYLFGRCGHRTVSCAPHRIAPTSGSAQVSLLYLRSRSAQAALLRVDLTEQQIVGFAAFGDRVTVEATLPPGAAWIDDGGLDGSVVHQLAHPQTSERRSLYALIDVRSCSLTTPGVLVVKIQGVSGGVHRGIAHVHLVELPLDTLRPQDGEEGVYLAWPDPRNAIERGAGSPPVGPTGVAALLELERRTPAMRWCWQIAGYQDATPTLAGDTWYSTAASFAPLNWRGGIGTSYSPRWRSRIRRVHGDTVSLRWGVRYLSVLGGKLRVTITPDSSAPQTVELDCTPSAVWATETNTDQIIVPAASGGNVTIEIDAQHTATDSLYLGALALWTEEALP
jgi:hypothetical protein